MMRVLLVTPFSPRVVHNHAAADVLVPLVYELGRCHDLHVFTTDTRVGSMHDDAPIVQLWTSKARPARRLRAASGIRPYWLRHDWPTQATAEAEALSRHLRAEVVHCEY